MLTVIGAGLPRTGTTSLKAALERLGFGPCHHMFELLQHPEQADRWRPVMTGESPDWERVFEGYRSAVDVPTAIYWRELAQAYPSAKIILTVRDPYRWHASVQNALTLTRPADAGTVPVTLQAMASGFPTNLAKEMQKLLGVEWQLGAPIDESYAVEAFNRHVAEVKAALPPGRLLVFEAGQGWGPLCDFLGVDAPTDEPFPHLNDTQTMQRFLQDMFETRTEQSTIP